MSWAFDEDALIAAVELVNRTGATSVEIGHTGDDDTPVVDFLMPEFIPEPNDEEVTWWAAAHYRGARVTVEQHQDPVAAAEQLARKLLAGGQCVGCKRQIAITSMHDGTGKRCRWTREGRHWMPSCPSGRRRVQDRIDQAAKQRATTNEGN